MLWGGYGENRFLNLYTKPFKVLSSLEIALDAAGCYNSV